MYNNKHFANVLGDLVQAVDKSFHTWRCDYKASRKTKDKCIDEARSTQLSPTEISHNTVFIKMLASTFQKALFTIDGNVLSMQKWLEEHGVRFWFYKAVFHRLQWPNQRKPKVHRWWSVALQPWPTAPPQLHLLLRYGWLSPAGSSGFSAEVWTRRLCLCAAAVWYSIQSCQCRQKPRRSTWSRGSIRDALEGLFRLKHTPLWSICWCITIICSVLCSDLTPPPPHGVINEDPMCRHPQPLHHSFSYGGI